ncbi:hypothetical protein C6P40_004879 [Pichia californica]|uniref:AMMECR1 domain-containing protein n=1 Tax=Pichia californica TaxID=460514 RepID=A0A9P6WLX0_9ASCO|nr:hypothetical protein C6P42_002102 [[Candida] californica]KAG0689541.1 hypothetical protein C6P40_004879 [[Candida] californica]
MTTVVSKETATYFAYVAINKLISTICNTPELSLSDIAKSIGYNKYNDIINAPLFVTWNIVDLKNDEHELRGCIGNFSNLKLPDYVKKYALISALEDSRFNPINKFELEKIENNPKLDLQCCVTVLHSFEDITNNLMDWIVGKHGIKLSFKYHNRSYSSTFLPEVASEQGWNKKETLNALIRKAGIPGRVSFESVEVNYAERYSGVKGIVTLSDFASIAS